MTDTSTEAIAALMDGVTPGPWEAELNQRGEEFWFGDGYWDAGPFITDEENEADARFIAAARELVPALADERDALRAENERLRKELRGFLVLWAVQLAKRNG